MSILSRRVALFNIALVVTALCVGSARADVIGTAEINAYYEDVNYAGRLDQSLGARQGPVRATSVGGPGAKQLFARGAIYWRESTGAVLVERGMWTKYAALDAEKGPLGMPTADEDLGGVKQAIIGSTFANCWTQEFDSGALIYHPQDQATRAVYGTLFDVWNKNDREVGPLGLPYEDSSITYTYVTLPSGLRIPLVSTATQSFQGAKIEYSLSSFVGPSGWRATLHPDRAVRVRVIMPFELGTSTRTCTRTIDETFWAHGTRNQTWEQQEFGGRCGTSEDVLRPVLRLRYAVQGPGIHDEPAPGNLSVRTFTWGVTRTSDGRPWGAPTVTDDWSAVVRSGMEETRTLGRRYEGDGNTPQAFPDDFMEPQRLTVRAMPIQASDIRF